MRSLRRPEGEQRQRVLAAVLMSGGRLTGEEVEERERKGGGPDPAGELEVAGAVGVRAAGVVEAGIVHGDRVAVGCDPEDVEATCTGLGSRQEHLDDTCAY